jgi:Family of unknown function (DUF6174)
MMKKIQSQVILVIVLVLFTACTASTPENIVSTTLKTTPIKTITRNNATVEPTATVELSEDYQLWMDKVAQAEKKWQISNIDSYEVAGQATWGWHQHDFQITVTDGQITSFLCRLEYDESIGDKWCSTDYFASEYTVPALFAHARYLIKWSEQASPEKSCFYANFDEKTGVPVYMNLDCPSWHDEEEKWLILFFPLSSP